MQSAALFIIATRNRHKAGEIEAILGESFEFRTLNDFGGAPDVVEDAGTFAGNASKKALELARWLSRKISNLKFEISNSTYVLADDSGLEVDALNGAPGVHSARFAALDTARPGNSPDAGNNAKLLRLLKDMPPGKRTARFRCVLALVPVESRGSKVEGAEPHPAAGGVQLFEGICEGRIGFAPQGEGGFGYDPLFIPDGFEETFAQLGEETKNRLSHRARALHHLKRWCDTGKAAPGL